MDIARSRHSRMLTAAFALIFLVGAYAAVNGQGSRSISSTGRRLDEIGRQAEKAQRDELEREMSGRKPTRQELQKAALLKSQIKEDFEYLQEQYNSLVTKLQLKEPLEQGFVSTAAENIHKRSSRLRENIPFPKRDTGSTTAESDAVMAKPGLRNEVSILCRSLHTFLTIPMFESSVVLDIEEAEKARDLLDEIIRKSAALRQPVVAGN